MKIKELKKPRRLKKFFEHPFWRRFARPLVAFSLVLAVGFPALFFAGAASRPFMEVELQKRLAKRGFIADFQEEGFRGSFQELLTTIKRPRPQTEEPETLDISVKFKDLYKIFVKRAEAMKRGLLFSSGDDYVSAKIGVNDENIKAKIRLKGDQTDHMEGKKWSFRIKVKGKKHFKGMRVFSIQHPKTRNYHFEKMALEHMRSHGILAPRYDWVKVSQNGEDKGVYAMEEHFSKELLESQGRREGPILRMDDGLIWENLYTSAEPLYHFKVNPVESFRTGKIEGSPALRQARDTAVGLYRGYVAGHLGVEDVFDLEQTAKFLALCEVWDSWHALWMGNMRFYYNPITAKLEPIAYDLQIKPPRAKGPLLNYYSATFKLFFPYTEGKLGELFFAYLKRYAREILSSGFSKDLIEKENKSLARLVGEYPWVRSYPLEKLKARAAQLLQASADNKGKMARMAPISPDTEFSTPLLAYEISPERLELHNLLPFKFEVLKIEQLLPTGSAVALEEKAFIIDSTPLGKAPSRVFVDLAPDRKPVNEQGTSRYRVWGRIAGQERQFSAIAKRYFREGESSALPKENLDDLLRRYDFFEYFPEKAKLKIKSGRHQVNGNVSLPEGVALEADAGAELMLPKAGMIIVRGAMRTRGSAQRPVRFSGHGNGDWKGIAVFAGEKVSKLQHTLFANTTGVGNDGWALTGGVNFYRSPLVCEFCRFEGTKAEDALNIISSKFLLKSLKINSTVSDAFDGDFAMGVIDGGEIYDIGGDGIDFSGSKIFARGIKFRDIHDKAVSAGEGSELRVRHLHIESSSAGIVSKDRSRVSAEDISLKNIRHFGLMAYTKKPEFGPATMAANRVAFEDVAQKTARQRASRLDLDGRESKEFDMDVKQLYKQGFMKK